MWCVYCNIKGGFYCVFGCGGICNFVFGFVFLICEVGVERFVEI